MEDDVEENNSIHLTKEEYERILEICRNPPEPSEKMLAAAKRYRERYKNDTGTSFEDS